MPENPFDGRPPKSPAQIRRVLTSIQHANEPRKLGPYAHGLPEAERRMMRTAPQRSKSETGWSYDSTPRTPAYSRELLLRRGGFVGGSIGFLFGLNVGLALPIMTVDVGLFALSPVVMSLLGYGIGVPTARVAIVDQRRDLFN